MNYLEADCFLHHQSVLAARVSKAVLRHHAEQRATGNAGCKCLPNWYVLITRKQSLAVSKSQIQSCLDSYLSHQPPAHNDTEVPIPQSRSLSNSTKQTYFIFIELFSDGTRELPSRGASPKQNILRSADIDYFCCMCPSEHVWPE